MTVRRIRLSRQAGWRKPAGAVVVSRPSKWGNSFVVDATRTRAEAVALFENALRSGDRSVLGFTVSDVRRELAGRDLACWCPLADRDGNRVPCHADVLLEVANPGWHP